MITAQPSETRQLNTLAINALCPALYQPKSTSELQDIIRGLREPFYLLGEGSNTLFTEDKAPILIKPMLMGKSVKYEGDNVYITVGCGENWHKLVTYCLEQGFYGIENLALIPGSVGAAPVQNIGAYGVELSNVLYSVNWFDFSSLTVKPMSAAQCQLAYRDSIFKHALQGKGVITSVTLKLSKQFTPITSYSGLSDLPAKVTPQQVYQRVIAIRQSKLPNPMEIPNAGSFFKNPIVANACFTKLIKRYPEMPNYPAGSGLKKLAAGWLIEQAGLKGIRLGEAGVHQHQALVLINLGNATGRDIIGLANHIRQAVLRKFDVLLEPEVRFVDHLGLTNILNVSQACPNP